jgi:hypothetical protein
VRSLILAAVVLCAFAGRSSADVIAYATPGGTYSQNFNSLITSGTSQPWSNTTPTLAGWNLFHVTSASDSTPVAVTTYNADNGGSTTGSFVSYGTGTNTDRALGGLGSGGAYFGTVSASGPTITIGWIALGLNNTTGATLSDVTLSFNGEQWRNGGNATLASQAMLLEYGIGNTFAGVTTWTAPGGNFNWVSPVNAATAAAVDGNVAGLVSGKGGTLSNVPWVAGSTLWVRWIEHNDTSNDHGLAIDDVSLKATVAVPEASPAVLGTVLCGLIGLAYGGRSILRSKS